MSAFNNPEQLEKLCVKYVEVSDSLSDRQVNRFEQLLLVTPGASPIVTRLCARKIASSKNPEEEFWRFYSNQKQFILNNSGFEIDPMIIACLKSVDEKSYEKIVVDIINKIEESLIVNGETIKTLTNIINNFSIKALSKMEPVFLQKVCRFRAKVDKTGIEKIKAILIGKAIETNNSQHQRPIKLSDDLMRTSISLDTTDKSDYETYIKLYFGEFFVLIQGVDDISAFMKIFYHNRYFLSFADDYISVLKKLEKKDNERWKRIVSWTSVYLITAERSDLSTDGLYKPFIRYLRTLDENELMNVRQNVIQNVPSSQCEHFFDEVRRKEGLSEKLGNLFHKNKN